MARNAALFSGVKSYVQLLAAKRQETECYACVNQALFAFCVVWPCSDLSLHGQCGSHQCSNHYYTLPCHLLPP